MLHSEATIVSTHVLLLVGGRRGSASNLNTMTLAILITSYGPIQLLAVHARLVAVVEIDLVHGGITWLVGLLVVVLCCHGGSSVVVRGSHERLERSI